MCGCREGIDDAAQRGVTRGHTTSQHGSTVLIGALRCGCKEMVELLLDRGASLEAKDRVNAALACTARWDHSGRRGRAGGWDGDGVSARCLGDVVRVALVGKRAVTCGHATLQNGNTALVRAAAGGHTDMVELLLDRGADLEAKNRVSLATVSMMRHGTAAGVASGPGAATARRRRVIVLVSCAGGGGRRRWSVDVGRGLRVRRSAMRREHMSAQFGATALIAAATKGHVEAVKLLLDRGADVEAKNAVKQQKLLVLQNPRCSVAPIASVAAEAEHGGF